MNRRGFFGTLVGTIAAAAIFGEGVTITIEKARVVAGVRELKCRWTMEMEQDLMAMHGLNAEQEILDAASRSMASELDRAITTDVQPRNLYSV